MTSETDEMDALSLGVQFFLLCFTCVCHSLPAEAKVSSSPGGFVGFFVVVLLLLRFRPYDGSADEGGFPRAGEA